MGSQYSSRIEWVRTRLKLAAIVRRKGQEEWFVVLGFGEKGAIAGSEIN